MKPPKNDSISGYDQPTEWMYRSRSSNPTLPVPKLPIMSSFANPFSSAFTRRQFLRATFGAFGAASVSDRGCAGGEWGVPYEGLYTDRFTYRTDDWIVVFASLRSGAQVLFDFVRLDVRPQAVMATFAATPKNFGNPLPGSDTAAFRVALAFPASELPPGVYMLRMPSEAMSPENRFNVFNGFPSDNSVAYFVVTPAVAGSSSRLLWVHDSLTGTAYGSFADQSIYPSATGAVRTVNFWRPGLDRAASFSHGNIPFLRNHGYEFEHVDLVDLATAPAGYLDAYDLVCFVGQFEYMPNEVMTHLASFQKGGGNLFVASHEFGIFRVRLHHGLHTMTTYKWDFTNEDPFFLSGDPEQAPYVAGLGMASPAAPFETEIIGQTVWPAHRTTIGTTAPLPVYNLGEAGWILEGTGIGAGDALPGALIEYCSGLCLAFEGGEPTPILGEEMRLPEDLVVWGAAPSNDGIDWRALPGRPTWEWPALPSGYATATWQRRSSGAQVVTLPSPAVSEWNVGVGYPAYDRMLLNIFARLSVRA